MRTGKEDMSPGLSSMTLRQESHFYIGKGERSQVYRDFGFVPAFKDVISQKTVFSRFSNGTPAPVHMLDGMPEDWIIQRDHAG